MHPVTELSLWQVTAICSRIARLKLCQLFIASVLVHTFMPAVPKRAVAKSCLGAGKKSTRVRPLLLTLAFFFG